MRCRGLRGTGWSRRPLAPSPSTLELAQQGQPGEVEGDVVVVVMVMMIAMMMSVMK